MPNLLYRSSERQPDNSFTSTGGLIRLVVRDGEFVGAVVVHRPWPWVLRKTYLCAEDVD